MRKLITVLFALLLASPCFATITRVQSKAASTGGTNATSLNVVLDSAPTNGNVLIVAATASPNVVLSINSTADVAWMPLVKTSGSGAYAIIFIGYVRTGSASATIAITNPIASAQPIAAVAAEYSGFTNAAFDTSVGATATSASPASGATPTTLTANELWLCAITARSTGTYTYSSPTNSFNIVAQTGTTNGTTNNDRSICLLDQVVSATGTANGGATQSSSNTWQAYTITMYNVASGASQTSYSFAQ